MKKIQKGAFLIVFYLLNIFNCSQNEGVQNTPEDVPVVSGITPTNSKRPIWTWTIPVTAIAFRYQLDSESGEWVEVDVSTTEYMPDFDLTAGSHTLYVQARNSDNVWSSSGSLTIIIDLSVPGTPSVVGPTPTNNPVPTWSWDPVAGAVLYRFELDGETGNWTETTDTQFTPGSLLLHGDHTLFVQARNAAQTWSATGSFLINVDLVSPDPPGGLCLSEEDNSGNKSDTITNQSSELTISGSSEPYAMVELFRSEDISLGLVEADENGIWSIDVSLDEGGHVLTAKQTDEAGNGPSVASEELNITVDLTCDTPVISGISSGLYNTNRTFTISGELNSVIEYSIDEGENWSVYSEAVTLSSSGSYIVMTRQTDLAENISYTSYPPVFITITGTTFLEVTISSPSIVYAGNQFNYTVSVINSGSSSVENVILQLYFPSGVTYVSSTGDFYSSSPSTGIWVAGFLDMETSAAKTITCLASPNLADGAVVNATLFVPGNTNDPGNSGYIDTALITIYRQADIECGASAPSSITAGGYITYTVSITNNGPSAATSVSVVFDTGSSLEYVSHSAGSGTFSSSSWTWQLSLLAPGETASILVVTHLLSSVNPGDTLNTVIYASSSEVDSNMSNNSVLRQTSVTE